MREIELLVPAANKEVAIQAILHGADAVYMGASSHGARKNASNSIEDIEEVVKFAHTFHARVYVTVNTLVYENEISDVEKLIGDLYRIGVDALIVQDMGILRMNIPPIALHASTQCDNRNIEQIKFLESVGFSQIVLARELSINEIREICKKVTVPVECFVHGALCVSYSGRCRASQIATGRSANRGECSQMCRFKYDLVDAEGKRIVKDKYLLSLRDFNASANVAEMIEAGVSSFKIEGRLKDASYVKNITAYYNQIINNFVDSHQDKYCRASKGTVKIGFIPDPQKSFNRGFTTYFLNGNKGEGRASLDTPKSLGEKIADTSELNNGDGISFKNLNGEFEGARVNRIEKGRIITAKPVQIPKGVEIRRTFNRVWETELAKETAIRKIWVDISIDENGVSAIDERGNSVRVSLDVDKFEAQKEMNPVGIFRKLGNTVYSLRNFRNELKASTFIPASQLTKMRNNLINALDASNEATYHYDYRKKEDLKSEYPVRVLDNEYNVANTLAENFYSDHSARVEGYAIETDGSSKRTSDREIAVMHTRYCIRRELGMCKRDPRKKDGKFKEPFYLRSGSNRFRLQFNCSDCGMTIFSDHS